MGLVIRQVSIALLLDTFWQKFTPERENLNLYYYLIFPAPNDISLAVNIVEDIVGFFSYGYSDLRCTHRYQTCCLAFVNFEDFLK